MDMMAKELACVRQLAVKEEAGAGTPPNPTVHHAARAAGERCHGIAVDLQAAGRQ